jgi:hypothetical protein
LADDKSCFEEAGEGDAFVVAEVLLDAAGERIAVDLEEEARGGDVEVAPVEASAFERVLLSSREEFGAGDEGVAVACTAEVEPCSGESAAELTERPVGAGELPAEAAAEFVGAKEGGRFLQGGFDDAVVASGRRVRGAGREEGGRCDAEGVGEALQFVQGELALASSMLEAVYDTGANGDRVGELAL